MDQALGRIGVLVAWTPHRRPSERRRRGPDRAELDDLLAVLTAVAGPVGSARVISTAPRIALAAGYDVEEALEQVMLDRTTTGIHPPARPGMRLGAPARDRVRERAIRACGIARILRVLRRFVAARRAPRPGACWIARWTSC